LFKKYQSNKTFLLKKHEYFTTVIFSVDSLLIIPTKVLIV